MRLLWWVWMLSLTACSSTADAERAPRAKSVAVEDLSADKQRVLRMYARAGAEWEQERAKLDDQPELRRFVIESLAGEIMKAQRALAGADADRALEALQRASAELARFGVHALPTLVALLDVADAVSVEPVERVLVEIGQPAVEPMCALLDDETPETRRRAASLLERLPHAGNRLEARVRARLVQALGEEPEWAPRTAVARALGARGSRDADVVPWRNALQAGLLDPDPLVFEASAQGLVFLGDLRAVPAMLDVLERAHTAGDLRRFQAIQAALVRLTRQREQTSIAAWRAWWESAQRR